MADTIGPLPIVFIVLTVVFTAFLVWFLVACVYMKKGRRFRCKCVDQCFGLDIEDDVGSGSRVNVADVPDSANSYNMEAGSRVSTAVVHTSLRHEVNKIGPSDNNTVELDEERLAKSKDRSRTHVKDRAVAANKLGRPMTATYSVTRSVEEPPTLGTKQAWVGDSLGGGISGDADDTERRGAGAVGGGAAAGFAPVTNKTPPRPVHDRNGRRPKTSSTRLEAESSYRSDSGAGGGGGGGGAHTLYENFTQAGSSNTTIKVQELEAYVLNKKKNPELFDKEFNRLPDENYKTCHTARKPENLPKNRFQNICAYDDTRVILDIVNGDPNTDYINANFLPDWKGRARKYIVTQGPRTANFEDFWRMIWQESVENIVMLTQLIEESKAKCDMYWPEEVDEQQRYGHMTVTTTSIDIFTDYVIRNLLVTNGGEQRHVTQFHFVSWLDKTRPEDGAYRLLNFRRKVRSSSGNSRVPLLVHCSAGVGRTGSYVVIDSLLDQAAKEARVDIIGYVTTLRKHRMHMVQTKEQYFFIHEAILEELNCMDYAIHRNSFLKIYRAMTKSKNFDLELRKLRQYQVARQDSDLSPAKKESNERKNRNPLLIPGDFDRPYLRTPWSEGDDYINAVFVDSFRAQSDYIVTQMPLDITVVDFWRLVYDQECYAIVMLDDPNDEQDCPVYWPEEGSCKEEYGPLLVDHLHTKPGRKNSQHVRTRDFRISLKKPRRGRVKPAFATRQFALSGWPRKESQFPSPEAILDLWKELRDWRDQAPDTDPRPRVIIQCLDGASRSGLLCTVLFAMEKLLADNEIDVFMSARYVTGPRPQFIADLKQYKYIYKVIYEYIMNNEGTL